MSNPYMQSMQPWPSLARFARTVVLAPIGLHVFIYDTDPESRAAQPPVLLVHGLGDEADTWRHLVLPLSQTRRVIALDLPGFGRSDKPRRAYTLSFYRATIIALLDALNITRVSMVGHSLGGIIAHIFAQSFPGRLQDLTLIDGCLSPLPQKVSLVMVLRLLPFLGERYYNGLRGRPDAAYASLTGYYSDINRLSDADRLFLYQRVNERVWSDGQRDAYFSVLRHMPLWMMVQQRQMLEGIAGMNVPTIVVWGEEDRIVPIVVGQALVKTQPKSRLVTIPRAGHMPHQEQPVTLLKAYATIS